MVPKPLSYEDPYSLDFANRCRLEHAGAPRKRIRRFYHPCYAAAARHQLAIDYTVQRRLT